MSSRSIDLNCDLGEGCPFDTELMPLISSANVACGAHAGDPAIAFATISAAVRHGVAVGAHPSFPDRANFGRTEMQRSDQQIFEDCVWQIGALAAVAKACATELRHVKPHGALYNMACREDRVALPVIHSVELFGLPVLGLPSSRLQALCKDRGRFVAEGFADRRYQPDGSLVPRNRSDAFIENIDDAIRQVEWLIAECGIETVCVHGDNPQALAFVRELRAALTRQGFQIRAFT